MGDSGSARNVPQSGRPVEPILTMGLIDSGDGAADTGMIWRGQPER
jgi:hypothetical protein